MGIYMAGKVSELLKEKWVLYLTTFFNKNMIVVSLCAMILTNLLVSIRHHEDNLYYQHIYREGLKNKNSKAKSKDSSDPEPDEAKLPDEAASLSETDEGDSEGDTKDVADGDSENLSMIREQNMKKLEAMKNKMGFKNKDK